MFSQIILRIMLIAHIADQRANAPNSPEGMYYRPAALWHRLSNGDAFLGEDRHPLFSMNFRLHSLP